jgi:ribonuclease HI
VGWTAPNSGWFKANWDAALESKSGRMGYGVVIRDQNGQVRAAQSYFQQGFLSPAAAEARAAIMAVTLCKEVGFPKIHLEGDAKGVIEAVMSGTLTCSGLGPLVEDIRMLLRDVSQWKMEFVRRDKNVAAHFLAKWAVRTAIDRIWTEAVPECIKEIIILEQAALGG